MYWDLILDIETLSDLELEELGAKVAAFADDTKLLKPINNENDVITMQEVLDRLYKWEAKNNMKFHVSKFKWLQSGNNTNIMDYVYMTNDCQDPILPDVCVRDLGIIMNNNCD